MIMNIVEYGHPALRSKGREVKTVDDRIRKLAVDMIDTMNDAHGVGLAAQQVGLPLQVCIVDVLDAEAPGEMRVNGELVDLADYMPLVLVNPEVTPVTANEIDIEGCLSFPGLQGRISRPESVTVKALTLEGETLEFEANGLLARAVQHEHDHLHGILFIDRMEPRDREEIAAAVEKLLRRNSLV